VEEIAQPLLDFPYHGVDGIEKQYNGYLGGFDFKFVISSSDFE